MKERKEKLLIIAFSAILGLCLLCSMAAIPYIAKIIFTFNNTGWLRGVVFTMVFIILQFKFRKSNNFAVCTLFLTIYTVFVVGWDIEGNAFFNKPLEWITQGTLNHSITDLETFGATTSWNVSFQILQENDNVITIPTILVILYRAVQYALWFVFVGYINKKTLIKLAMKKNKYYNDIIDADTIDADMEEKIKAEIQKREDAKQKKVVSEELYKQIKELKEKGETIRAIKILRDATEGTWTLKEAKEFIDAIPSKNIIIVNIQ